MRLRIGTTAIGFFEESIKMKRLLSFGPLLSLIENQEPKGDQQQREKQIGQCVEHATHQKAIQEGEKVADQREGARPDQEKGYAEGGEKALVGDGLTGRNAVIQMVAVKEGEKPDDHRRHTDQTGEKEEIKGHGKAKQTKKQDHEMQPAFHETQVHVPGAWNQGRDKKQKTIGVLHSETSKL